MMNELRLEDVEGARHRALSKQSLLRQTEPVKSAAAVAAPHTREAYCRNRNAESIRPPIAAGEAHRWRGGNEFDPNVIPHRSTGNLSTEDSP